LSGRTVRTGLVCLLILLPWLYVAFNWAPVYVKFVTEAPARVGLASAWDFYAREFDGLMGPHLLILAAFGIALGLAGNRRRRESLLLLLFAGTIYAVLSLLRAQERRYALLLCVPAVCFMAIALHSAAEWFVRLLRREPATVRVWAPALVAVVCALQARAAASTPVPAVNGFREVVAFIEEIAPAEPVLYDGYFDGIFTFYLQAGDPGFRRQVVRGSKLLYTSAMNPLWRYREFVSSTDEVVQALRTRGGCRWIVVERSRSSEGIPAARLVRNAVAGPQFELMRSFPISGLGLQAVEVYRLKPDVEPAQEWDIPFQILGDGTRIRIRPIKR
jgi:hypothetical protein